MQKTLDQPELPEKIDDAHVVIKDLHARLDRTHKSYEQQIALYKEKIRILANKLFAAKSDSVAVSIFNEVELVSELPEEAAIDQSDNEKNEPSKGRSKKRKIIPDHLPSERVIHDLPVDRRYCNTDGSPLHKIGEEITRELDFVPAKFRVIEHVTIKYGCRSCEAAPVQSSRPQQLLPKSVLSTNLLSHIIYSKYEMHLPLFRQQQDYAKHGVHLTRDVMARSIIQVGRACQPLINLMFEDIKAGKSIQCDETPYRVLTVDGVEVSQKSYLWVTARWGPEKRAIVFHHARTRSGSVAKELLGDYEGYLQVDGYPGYDWVNKHPKIRRVGCLAHIRRKFTDFLKSLPKKAQAIHTANRIVGLIRELYKIEEEARENPHLDLKSMRDQKSRPIFNDLENIIASEAVSVSLVGAYGTALTYASKELPRVSRYLDAPEVQIDNNLVENALRPFCLGKKNWLFAQTEDGGEASAALYSLIVTAKANGQDAQAYLKRVIDQLPACKTVADYEALLPYSQI